MVDPNAPHLGELRHLLPVPPWRKRLPPLAVVAYVGSLAVWVDGGAEPRGVVVAVAAFVIAFVATRTAAAVPRWLGLGLALVVASLGARTGSHGLDVCGGFGAMVCTVAACAAVARLPSAGGLVRGAPWSPRPAAAVVGAAWSVATLAAMAPDRGAAAWMTEHARAWAIGAEAVSVLSLWLATEWTARRRRLELGVVERAAAMRALLGMTCVAAALAGLAGEVRGEAMGRGLVAAAALVVALAALARDPVRVARVTRRIVVLAIVGGGVVMLGASAAEGRSWAATLVTGAVALAIGAAGSVLESPLRPVRGAWLDAFERASNEASRGDPEDAVREVLAALRRAGGPAAASPELWTFEPTRVTTVDAAGYAREREGEMPEAIVLVAAGEPEGTLRFDVLHALEVRRPELRPMAQWMADHDALLVTAVASEGDVEGLLVFPRMARDEPVTLEELRGLKHVADRLAAACRARQTQARMLARVHEAALRADAADERVERLRHERELDVGRDALAATRLARPATIGVYSAASRMALEALERRTLVGAPIAVVAPSGVDPVPYLARAHLSGARREAPLVLVDSTSAREHDLARWTDANASPLALANRGMLVLLDGAALPQDVQQLVARSLSERRAPWERPDSLDVQLALTGVAPPDELVAQGRLDLALALRLADAREAPIALPRLRDRPEDLRAILTDRLAREGLRVLGRPVGIEHAAFARLVDHPFPGEEAELAAAVQQLVARCKGDVVRAADVDSLELGSPRPAHAPRKDPLSA
jgi:hypothetical protein